MGPAMQDQSDRVIPGAAVGVTLLIVVMAVAAVFLVPDSAPPAAPTPEPVRLVVLVVFDQMRADLIGREERRELFGPGGFRRLQDDGAWFTDCHYPYSITATGPGHAAMLTGAPPAVTGIVNNEWYDRSSATEVYCAGDKRYAVVPKPVKEPKYGGGNPDKVLAPTVADSLKEATSGRGKVFGLSLKDRSAAFPTGKHPDGAFWFDGRFVTSTYYADAVPAWVAEFNASGKADSYFGKDWTRGRPDLDYDKLAGPDKGAGEGVGYGQGEVFPHPMTGGKDKEGRPFADPKAAGSKYYEALAASPFGNELLLAFAEKCIDAEGLGTHDVPDLLTVSFSSNDLIGHVWGPDSQEVLDVTLRADAVLAELLAHLDAKVGKGRYAVVLTADHGVCPIPEQSAARGIPAKRVKEETLRADAEKHLQEKFGKPDEPKDDKEKKTGWIASIRAPYLWVNPVLAKAKGQSVDAVADEVAKWVRTQDGVERVYTAAELNGPVLGSTPTDLRVRKSFYQERSGDVYVVLKPYYLFDRTYDDMPPNTGTSHGTPHEYDTHVPLLVYGPGVDGGKRDEKVTPLAAAAIAARFLGVPPPAKAEYPVPKTLLR